MISFVTGTIGLTVAVLILFLMRKDRLHVKHGLVWVGVSVGFAFLGLSPGIIDWVARLFGVAYPPVLALTLGIALLVIKTLMLDIESSRIELRNQRLIQRLAMLEADMKALQNEAANDKAIGTTSRRDEAATNLH